MKKKIDEINTKRSIRSIPIPKRGNDEKLYEKEFSMDESKLEKEIEKERERARTNHASNHASKSVHANYSHIHHTKLSNNHYHKDSINTLDSEDIPTRSSGSVSSSGSGSGSGSKSKSWLIISVVFVAIAYFLSVQFSKATIYISPSYKEISINNQNVMLEDVKHDAVIEKFSEKATIKVSGTKKIDQKATGKVILYNNYSSAAQKLVKNTRLEIPEGLVYLLVSDATIPGMKTVSGKKVAGSVEVNVIASQSGEKYNAGMKDFSLVAYKGTDRYSSIYGRSKTSLSGGYSGTVPDINETDLALTLKSLKKLISEAVDSRYTAIALKKKEDEKLKDTPYIYIPKSYLITYGEPKQVLSKDGKSAEITLEANVMGIVFNKQNLTDYLAGKILNKPASTSTTTSTSTSDSQPLAVADKTYLIDFDKVNMSVSASTTLTMLNTNSGSLIANGTTTITTHIDEQKILRSVSGLDKDQSQEVLRNLIDFSSLDIKVSPFWIKKMPKIDNIEIKLVS